MDIENLESDADVGSSQDFYKGTNLKSYTTTHRRGPAMGGDDNKVDGIYDLIMRTNPDRDYVINQRKVSRDKTSQLLSMYTTKNDI